jgi:hypothetical protein
MNEQAEGQSLPSQFRQKTAVFRGDEPCWSGDEMSDEVPKKFQQVPFRSALRRREKLFTA